VHGFPVGARHRGAATGYGAREFTVGVVTNRGPEFADGETSMTVANDLAVRRALELAGVEFIDENGGGPGCAIAQTSAEDRLILPASIPALSRPIALADNNWRTVRHLLS
jgi:hypothetical protein